jgi:hypothetical protein
MHKRPTKNPGLAAKTARSQPAPATQNEKKSAPISEKDEFSARAARVKSSVRKILLASPLFPRLYADVVISSAPNSYEAKILARNYKKIVERTNLDRANLERTNLDRTNSEKTNLEKTNRTNMPVQPSVKACTHIQVTGVRCGSPPLRGEQFCYFHQRMVRGVATPPNARLHPIALIESEEAIQASLMEVINALARNTIDLKRAELLLRALHIAVRNARRVRFHLHENEMVREVPNYPTPPNAVPPAPEPPVEINAPPLTELQTWATLTVDAAEADPTRRKPPARAGLPAETKKVAIEKGG